MISHRIPLLACALAASVVLSFSGCHTMTGKSSSGEAVNLMDEASKARD